MQAYEARNPSYFATPPVNLIQALETSLALILEEGMDARFARHRRLAQTFRNEMRSLGLSFIPKSGDVMAHTLSAPYFAKGMDGPAFLKSVGDNGVVIAGGLLPSHKTQYFRVGHMGIVNDEHINRTVGAISKAMVVERAS
jgi:alanine-glyoxylate transaminase/serine-glyoxylate transaminase/serine-pyruvate transaminase